MSQCGREYGTSVYLASENVCEVMQVNDQRGLAKVIFEMFRLRVERLAS